MATKLDEQFVALAIETHPKAEHFINTLANEVRRLEAYCAALEDKLDSDSINEASQEASKNW